MELSEISARLERLERQNRTMKRAGFGLLAAALAVALIGAATPEEIPEVIEAREFRVIDENGKRRTTISANGFGYHDENGQTRALIDADGFRYGDENGKVRAGMGADGFGYLNANSTIRAMMGAAGFSYADENGQMRALMGVAELVSPETGMESRYPAAVVLFDADGNLIWRAP
jgi:hypothetical protein